MTYKRMAGLAFTALLILILGWLQPHSPLEYRVQDSAFQQPCLPYHGIIILGIDEPAWEALGAWPWPRSLMAEVINILNYYEEMRPAVIAVDVLYDQPSHFFPEGDLLLAEAARQGGNVLLASSFNIGQDIEGLRAEPVITAHITPFDAVLPYAQHGIINAVTDADGLIRNALLWDEFEGTRIYSFPLLAAQMYLQHNYGYASAHPFIEENRTMFLRYTGLPGHEGTPGDFFGFSLADVFESWFKEDVVATGWLADTIVLIGAYSIGMMDHYPTPIYRGAPMYGVEIHANAIQAILEEAFKLRVPDWVGVLLLTAFILLGMLIGEFVDVRIALPIFGVLGVGYYFGALQIFTQQYYVLPMLGPPMVLGIIAVYQLIYGYALRVYEKGKIKSAFRKYVDPNLVDALVESGEADHDGVGKKKHIAVLFVDVRGFTPLTERFADTPELIVETLNAYLELTSASVFNNGGSVDKFIGDATMALFNGFVPLDDYVYKAVKAAWDIVQGAAEVNAAIKEKYGIDLGFGVGVNCGEAIVGNLGPSFRKDYTAIGDAINTAARLESSAQRSQVLISQDIVDILGERIQVESIGAIPLKGKSVPLEVYVLRGVGGTKTLDAAVLEA
jgi:adenylate cyclase